MNRQSSRLASLAVIFSFALFAFACGGSSAVPDEEPTRAQAQESRTVVMYQYRYNPNSLRISSGTTVVFQNRDPEAHNVNIAALNIDENVAPNTEWSYTFSTRGEFAVGNRFSEGMRLDIVVE